jgi:Domain of unknown function (DUF4288)
MPLTKAKAAKSTVRQFKANLLFTYTIRGRSRKRTPCESRLVLVSARSVPAAIAAARRYGSKEDISYLNPDGELFEFKFVGLIDLIDRTYLEPSEVWHSLFVSKNPRRKLKSDSRLEVYRKGGTVGDAWWMVPRAWVAPSDRKPVRPTRHKRR